MKRVLVLTAVIGTGLASLVFGQGQATAPGAPDPANFTGKVTPHDTSDIRMSRYSFEPGARTNWHSHAGGQVIVIEQGRMRAQERGGPGKEFRARETYVVAAGVAHWHGALPGEPLTQVALSYGTTTWMARVTDQEYAAAASR